MNKRTRRKRASLTRAFPAQPSPGSTGVVIPAHILSSMFAQMSSTKNPKPENVLFSPGEPLTPQPNVNPKGMPISWQYPPAYNISGVDRQMGNREIPVFQQLRTLARAYDGIGLCERAILDLVPRLKLTVKLTDEAIAGGADEKNYQKEITYFKNFFAYPSLGKDIHTWLRMAWREQTQIDELYLFKQKDRAGRLLSLDIVDGSGMKPLLDVWGRVVAYQQYPRGIPGAIFTPKQMIRYNESPAAESPFGTSRVERIMLRVNQALRKEQKDLARFTEGNLPEGLMQVPKESNWTPDQIDAYSQLWNALIAGQVQQQVRMHFTQPGFEYVPLEDITHTGHLTEFDQFLLNITTGIYGLSMGDLSFTEDIHKSSGDSQQNMLGRRTLYPLTSMYGLIFTTVMRQDFEPSMHGNLLEAAFTGFEEAEDIATLSKAYRSLTDGGILGLSNAAKILKLPEEPEASHIGRVIIVPGSAPIFLDDAEFMAAHKQATLAALEAVASPAGATTNDDNTDEGDNTDGNTDNSGGKPGGASSKKPGETKDRAVRAELNRWRTCAMHDLKGGRRVRAFESTLIPDGEKARISDALQRCSTADEVKAVFDRARDETIAEGAA